jgi:hypothetical protein
MNSFMEYTSTPCVICVKVISLPHGIASANCGSVGVGGGGVRGRGGMKQCLNIGTGSSVYRV